MKKAMMKTLFAFTAGLVMCAQAQANANEPYYTPTDTIVILGAVPQEVPTVINDMKNVEKKSAYGIPYWQGTLHGKPVVVAITGIGKTFTAMTTTLFIQEFKPRVVVMTGTGARVNQSLRTGDVIVPTHTYEHDYGSLTKNDMVYRDMTSPDDGKDYKNEFSPNQQLLKLAEKAMAEYPAQSVTANDSTYENKVRFGVVASSDLFGVTDARLNTLRNKFKTDIMEMESAPLGHVCEWLGVPYIIVRAGSNVAQEAPNNDYLRLGPIAAKEAAKFTSHLVKYL